MNKKIQTLYQLPHITAINCSFDDIYSHNGRQPKPVCSTNNCEPGAEFAPVWWFTIFRDG